jgi:hypothetical protein
LPKPIGALTLYNSPARQTKNKRDENGETAAATTGDFTITVEPSVMNADYQEMDATITLTGTGGFTGPVDLSCAVTPPNVGSDPLCGIQIDPVTLDPSNTTATGTLIIDTLLPGCSPFSDNEVPIFPRLPNRTPTALLFGVGTVVIFSLVYARSSRPARSRWAGALAAMTLLAAGLGTSGCAGSKPLVYNQCIEGLPTPGTLPGTYTIMVIATSGPLTHTANVTFTVPPQS